MGFQIIENHPHLLSRTSQSGINMNKYFSFFYNVNWGQTTLNYLYRLQVKNSGDYDLNRMDEKLGWCANIVGILYKGKMMAQNIKWHFSKNAIKVK